MIDLSLIKDVAPLVGATVGLTTFIFASYQYSIAQNWKRNEFLAKEMKEFLGDEKIKEAFRFFDYWGSSFSIKVQGQDRNIRVFHTEKQLAECILGEDENYVCLTSALKSGEDAIFSNEEQAVREYIDHFISSLERICAFRENKLFRTKEMLLFIRYHIDTFNGLKLHSKGYHNDLFNFLFTYGYTLTIKLLSEFPKSEDAALAAQKASLVQRDE